MKKQLLLMIMMLLPMMASADAVEINGIYYNLISKIKKAEVTGNPYKYKGEVVIPESVVYDEKIYSVTSIGESAFNRCSGLISVAIPNSVTIIEYGAFYGCNGLTSVTIPNSVTSIGDCAFFDCRGLTSVTIGNSVTSIGDAAFQYCSSLTSITIPNSVTSIKGSAFQDCSGLSSITIPNSVTSIGHGAFVRCSSLTSINVESGNTVYDSRNNCNAIIHSETNELIKGCNNTVIPNSVTTIGYEAFSGCSGLSFVTIPNSVTSIGELAFSGCIGLTSVTIGNSVTSIGYATFYGCSSLTSITIGNSVTSIGHQAFFHCSGLTSVTIPNSVTNIGGSAFSGCSSLSSITIPNSVTSIGNTAFEGCQELNDVYCYAKTVPTTPDDVFKNAYIEYATLHVPTASINDYKAVEPWKGFKEIVKIQMPEHQITYIVDEEIYKAYSIEEGENITPETEPTKEGYTFSGWSEIPEAMPAEDVTVIGSFTINKYKLTYKVDGEEYASYELDYGANVTSEPAPTKEGYTFSGWSEIPATMPAENITVTGSFTINKYKLTYQVDGKEYKTYEVEYGLTIIPEPQPEGDYVRFAWVGVPEKMPAHDVTVTADFETGITDVIAKNDIKYIYGPNGKRVNKLQKGVNIVVMKDGTIRKVILKSRP